MKLVLLLGVALVLKLVSQYRKQSITTHIAERKRAWTTDFGDSRPST